MFTYMLHGLARAYVPQVSDVLCIGLGIGIVPSARAVEIAVDVDRRIPVRLHFLEAGIVDILSAFIALLELARRGALRVEQTEPFASIVIRRESPRETV